MSYVRKMVGENSKRVPNWCRKRKVRIEIHCARPDQHHSWLYVYIYLKVQIIILFTLPRSAAAQKIQLRKLNGVTILSICITYWNSVHTRSNVELDVRTVSFLFLAFSHGSQTMQYSHHLRANLDEPLMAMKFDFYCLMRKSIEWIFALFAFRWFAYHKFYCMRFGPRAKPIDSKHHIEIKSERSAARIVWDHKLKIPKTHRLRSTQPALWNIDRGWLTEVADMCSMMQKSRVPDTAYSSFRIFKFTIIFSRQTIHFLDNHFSLLFFFSPYLQIASKRYWAVTRKYW